MDSNCSHISKFSRASTHLLLLYPILNIYTLKGTLSYGRAFLLMMIGCFIIKQFQNRFQSRFSTPKYFNIFCLFWFVSIFLSITWIGFSVIMSLPGTIYLICTMMLFFSEVCVSYLVKWYRIYGLIFIGFLFIQELLYYTTGMRVLGVIPDVPLMVESGDNAYRYFEVLKYGYRSTSFFSEPAHFAQWLLPLLAYELMLDDDKLHYVYSCLIIFALLLLRSGNAMFGLVVILAVFFVYILFVINVRHKSLLISMIVLTFIVGSYYYLNSTAAKDVFGRQEELQLSGSSSDKMGSVRLYRGYYVFSDYNILEKLIGMSDVPSLLNYIKKSRVASFFADDETFFNCIQSFLLKNGCIGLFLFFLMCLAMIRRGCYASKAIVLSFVALSFVSGLYFTPTMALYLTLGNKLNK